MKEFIERLPFQAIRCSLAEVVPVNKDWYSEVGDRLIDLTRSSCWRDRASSPQ